MSNICWRGKAKSSKTCSLLWDHAVRSQMHDGGRKAQESPTSDGRASPQDVRHNDGDDANEYYSDGPKRQEAT